MGVQSAAAEPCNSEMPREIKFAQGYTFIATLTAHHGETPESRPPGWTFAVERVFAGEDRPVTSPIHVAITPGHITKFDGRCAPVQHLQVGHRYLISKADLLTFSSMSTVAWELLPDDRIRLVLEYGGRNADARLFQPRTLAEAVALMAPNALPPTDLMRDPVLSTDSGPLLITGASLLGACAWVLRSNRRAR
jgi:hypothetical protein